MVKIAVFVSGGGTNLQALIDAQARGEINGEIVLVVSNKESAYGLERARKANIKAEFIKDEDIIIKRLAEEKVDLIEKLTKEMNNAARELNFERAMELRDIIFELESE